MSLSEQVLRRSFFKIAAGIFLSSGAVLASRKSIAAPTSEIENDIYMSSISELREKGNASHKVIKIGSFNNDIKSEYSGGTFKFIEGDEQLKDDGGITIKTSSGVFFRREFDESKKSISALWFGCVGDGVYDNTNESQSLLDYCTLNGYEAIYPKGNFYHKNSVVKKMSPQCPSISGAGYGTGSKVANYTSLIFASGSSLILKGGSGVFSGAILSNLIFKGTDPLEDCPLIIADQCGVRVKNCAFTVAGVGAKLINEGKGGFTEFVVFDECIFRHTCKTAIEYVRLKGNDSFHGSGIWNCLIQGGLRKEGSQIIIGEGCLLYNAPMQFSVFKRYSAPVIHHEGHPNSNVYGNITVEKRRSVVELVGPRTPLLILGNLSCLSENLRTKFAFFCEKVQCNSDGSVTYQRKAYSLKTILPEGGGDIAKFSSGETAFIAITVSAPNYKFKYLLALNIEDGSNEGSVSVITKFQNMDSQKKYGAPVFEINNGRLSVLNPNYPKEQILVVCTVTPLDTRFQFKLL